MGAHAHVAPRFQTLFKTEKIRRPRTRSGTRGGARGGTATGYGQVHAEEQVGLVKEALTDPN